MSTRTFEASVGLFVIIGVASILFLAFRVSGLVSSGDSGYQISAYFNDVGGLRPRSAVTLGGVKVGEVTTVAYDMRSYKARVDMRIDSAVDALPLDTSASIYTAGLLGDQYIALVPGAEDDVLSDGGQLDITESAMVLERVIGQFLFSMAESGGES